MKYKNFFNELPIYSHEKSPEFPRGLQLCYFQSLFEILIQPAEEFAVPHQ